MNGYNPTVLIVDDSDADLTLTKFTLMDNGYKTEIAFDGSKAFDLAKKIIPDVIILDVFMPGIDGFELCRQIKNNEKLKDIPIILVTGSAENDVVLQAFECGASDYICKPFKKDELLARLKKHLKLRDTMDFLIKQNNDNKALLHVLCHDLSTPFNGIISFKEIMSEINNLDKMKKYFNMINFSALQGLDVISLVRKMRGLSDGKLTLSKCNLKESLKISYRMLEKKFKEKNLNLELEVADNLYVYAEETSLVNSVLNNIFTNALKFSFPNSRIRVNSIRNNNYTSLAIKDYGVGMSKEIIKNLFIMNKTTTRTGTYGEIGTGLGMSLINKFINAYGGNIKIISKLEAESNVEHGTEVIVTFRNASFSA